jgi:catechol 2,3-dioxygenase-like lactoylglutathione lyase family enzyme
VPVRVQSHPEQRAEMDGYAVRRIHHVGITVAQLDRSMVFYRDLLGMRVLELCDDEDVGAIVGLPGGRARIADLDAGNGQILELLEYLSAAEASQPHRPDLVGSCHISLQVGDLNAALARLASAGILPAGEVAKLSGGGVWQDCLVVYLRDPDGVFVELIEGGANG